MSIKNDIKILKEAEDMDEGAGFRDVTGMSDKEVQRMGHADDGKETRYFTKVQRIAFFKIPFDKKDDFKAMVSKHKKAGLKYFFNKNQHPQYPNHWAIVFYTQYWTKKGERVSEKSIYEFKFPENVRKDLEDIKQYYSGTKIGFVKKN